MTDNLTGSRNMAANHFHRSAIHNTTIATTISAIVKPITMSMGAF